VRPLYRRARSLLLAGFAAAAAAASAAAQEKEPGEESAAQQKETAGDLEALKVLEQSVARGALGGSTSREIDDYVKDFPDSARARLLRAELRRRKGSYEEAAEDLAHARPRAETPELHRAFGVAAFDLDFERGDDAACSADLDFGLGGSDAASEEVLPLHARRIVLAIEQGDRKQAFSIYASRFKDARSEAPVAVALEYGRALTALRDLDRAAQILVPVEKSLRDAHDPRQVEALVLLARLYRLSRSQGDATPALKAALDALAVDPQSIPALVERARTRLLRWDDDGAEEAADAALAVNPRHTDALAARAEVLLRDQRVSEGLAAAEAALKENGRHGPGLALRAAALWLLGRKEEAEKAAEALEASHPKSGEDLCRIADTLNYLYRFADAIPFYRRALAAEVDWTLSYVGLCRCLLNTGRQKDALEAIEQFRARDRYPYALADNTEIVLRKLEGFVELKRGNFTYVVDPVESPLLVPLLEELYGKAWPDLCARYGFDPQRKVRVECFPRHADFSVRTVGFTGFGALGVCFGDVFTLLSPRSEMRGDFAFDTTAVHELTHVVTLGLSSNKVPRWLTEGISVHEEHVFHANADREMDLELFNYYHSGEIVPIRELNRLFGGPKILFGYYQGGLLCDFLVGKYGEAVLTKMLKRFAVDEEAPQVVQAVLGCSAEELDRDFLAWLDATRIAPMKVQPIYTEVGRQRLLARVQSSDRPDAALLAQVAFAYQRAGRSVDRDDFLQRALKADPKLPAARFLLAERALTARHDDEAKRELEAGFAAGGEEFFALLQYARLLAREGKLFEAGPEGEPGEPHAAAGHPRHGKEAPVSSVKGEGGGPPLSDAQKALAERVLEVLAHAKRCFPRYVSQDSPYFLRAQIFQRLGREDDALEELRAFCAVNDTDGGARSILVKHALERDDFEEADKYLLEMRAVDPFQRQLWRDLARCEKELKRPAEAIRMLTLALAIDPSTEPHYDPGRPPEVRQAEDAATRAQLLFDLADLYVLVGERERARRSLDEGKQLAPDDERAAELARRLETPGR
jgi:tetratricopeptide (TPR) repeat protein